ncbi:MAG: hypothetical protein KJT03_10295, partial [Verrucomicrobiae bacterium]|nr:hypothetical protein [Verrucomicrobiae bacterium]
FNLMKKIGATFSVPVFALVVSGILIRKAPSLGAKIIVFTGISLYILGNVFPPEIAGQPLHWLHVTGFTFALLIIIMLVMSKTHPVEPRMDIPTFWGTPQGTGTSAYWSGTKILGSAVILIVIFMYAFFHWF